MILQIGESKTLPFYLNLFLLLRNKRKRMLALFEMLFPPATQLDRFTSLTDVSFLTMSESDCIRLGTSFSNLKLLQVVGKFVVFVWRFLVLVDFVIRQFACDNFDFDFAQVSILELVLD